MRTKQISTTEIQRLVGGSSVGRVQESSNRSFSFRGSQLPHRLIPPMSQIAWWTSHDPTDRLKMNSIEESARRRVDEHPAYANCYRDVTYRHEDGVLTLQGRVPSFYLKQILQETLRGLDGVVRIDNQTDVVSATGLSSIPKPR